MEGDPLFNTLLEDVHGERAAIEDFIVESTDVEFVTELILGVLAKVQNFELANFVA